MRKLTVIFRQSAVTDLEEIWLYTFRTWSQEQADRYHGLIFKEIDFLSRKPLSGKSQEHIRIGYFSAKVKSHVIFYKFSATELEIIRILHQSMDLPRRL